MTRLFINLFFIIIICFTLSAMPINTEILNMFDFEDIFSKEEPADSDETEEETDITFEPEFSYSLKSNTEDRIYNPEYFELSLETNLTEDLASDYDFESIEMIYERNKGIYQSFQSNQFITDLSKVYVDEKLIVNYTFNLSKDHLNLDQNGFYHVSINSDFSGLEPVDFKLAYLDDIELINPTTLNTNYSHLAYFYNEDKSHVLPITLNRPAPNSITVAVRDSLYKVPSETTGIYPKQVIPNQTSLTRISEGYYAVFLYSREFEDLITTTTEAQLMVEALSKTLLALPHIDRLSLYVDDRQVAGTLFDIDLSQVFEEDKTPLVYYPDNNSQNKSYLLPVALEDESMQASIFNIIEVLTTGYVNDTYYGQIIPSEVKVNNLLIEESHLTLDFNDEFLSAYPEHKSHRTLMIHSLLYSISSIEGIESLSITVDGQAISAFGDYDLSLPLVPEKHINYIEGL